MHKCIAYFTCNTAAQSTLFLILHLADMTIGKPIKFIPASFILMATYMSNCYSSVILCFGENWCKFAFQNVPDFGDQLQLSCGEAI